jgi:hypothetical protein
MNNGYKKDFILIVLIVLCFPLIRLLGIKGDINIYGKENITQCPNIYEHSFKEKRFQQLFEQYWNSNFAFRRIMLKAKNQLYDWMNFGYMHSADVIEGKNEYLFEKGYFDSFAKNCKNIPTRIQKIRELNVALRKNNIELFFVLAPNKAVTYFDFIPKRYKYYLGKGCNWYNQIEEILQKFGINVFNAQKLASYILENEDYPPFSITGTHWNHYAAARTVQESAKKFNWGEVEIESISESNSPYTTERDLEGLLNLLIKPNPKSKFYKPVFYTKYLLKGNTTIIGNSFSNEFVINFRDSRLLNGIIYHFENAPLIDSDIKKILNSKRIILVYTDIDVINDTSQLYKKIDFILNSLYKLD